MNILFIDDTPLFSGGQKMLLNYLQALSGQRLTLVRHRKHPEPVSTWNVAKLYQVDFPNLGKGMSKPLTQLLSLPSVLRSAFQLLRVIHAESPALIIANSFYTLIPLFILKSTLIKTPIVYVVHTSDIPVNRAGLRLLNICNGWIGCCKYVLSRIPDTDGIRQDVVYNAVASSDAAIVRSSKPKSCFTIVFAGRLIREKHPLELIKAIELLRDKGLEAEAYILGDGPEMDSLRAFVSKSPVKSSIHIMGNVDNSREYMAAADTVCLPSKFEGLPICLLEGMADGVPPIASAFGGATEIIEHGRNGIILDGTDAAAIADGITALRKIPAEQLRTAVLETHRAKFSIETQMETFKKVIAWHLAESPR